MGDINLDSQPDRILSAENAVVGGRRDYLAGVCRRMGQPGLGSSRHQRPEGIKCDINLLFDLDDDGDPDVINTEESNNSPNGNAGLGLVWYENPSN